MNIFKILFLTITFGISNLYSQGLPDPWPKGKIKAVKLNVYKNSFELTKQPISTTEAEFNKERKITELTEIHFFDDFYQKQDWIRNNSDSTITSKIYDKNGKFSFVNVFHIDGKGHYKYEISYNLEDNSVVKNYYTYNEYGNKTKILFYDKRGNLYGEDTFQYDENHNLTDHKRSYFNSSIGEFQRKYEFDSNNNLIQKEQYGSSKNLLRKDNYIYNKSNLLIEQTIKNSKNDENEIIFYKYISFDDFGNWTKRLIFDNKMKKGVPKRTETREIVYY